MTRAEREQTSSVFRHTFAKMQPVMLRANGPMTAKDLAEATSYALGTIRKALAEARTNGHVTAVYHPGRASEWKLTDAGRNL